MIKQIKNHLPEIIRVFKKNEAVLALLFGSAVTGKQTALSDLDFAVLLSENVSKKKYFNLQLELMGQLSQITKKDKVDVVILNNASPLIGQMAIVHGQVIFCQDEDLKAQFFSKALQRFDDALYLSKTYNHYLEHRVFSNKLGEKL